jgi:1D-myo-inositol-tetrakisphosphate 5-kinase/inositol-polyphosphate multikinase
MSIRLSLKLEGRQGYCKIQLVVLENVAHGFRKANILDIKLGTVLYDEDAPPKKKERMQDAARRTTSGQVGIRLTGFQVRARCLPKRLA